MEDLGDSISRKDKMRRFIDVLYRHWYTEVDDTISLTSLEDGLFRDIPPDQQVALLRKLANNYNCLTFEQDLLWNGRENVPDGAVRLYSFGKDDEFSLEKTRDDLSLQRWFEITFKDNFPEVYREILHRIDATFKLHIENTPKPVLYVNETPIRNFKNLNSNSYKLMKYALGLPNGSVVLIKDALKEIKTSRGCSQEISGVLKSPAMKAVFAREITKSSFKIYHEIVPEDLNDIPYFKKASVKEGMYVEHFIETIEKYRVAL